MKKKNNNNSENIEALFERLKIWPCNAGHKCPEPPKKCLFFIFEASLSPTMWARLPIAPYFVCTHRDL